MYLNHRSSRWGIACSPSKTANRTLCSRSSNDTGRYRCRHHRTHRCWPLPPHTDSSGPARRKRSCTLRRRHRPCSGRTRLAGPYCWVRLYKHPWNLPGCRSGTHRYRWYRSKRRRHSSRTGTGSHQSKPHRSPSSPCTYWKNSSFRWCSGCRWSSWCGKQCYHTCTAHRRRFRHPHRFPSRRTCRQGTR